MEKGTARMPRFTFTVVIALLSSVAFAQRPARGQGNVALPGTHSPDANSPSLDANSLSPNANSAMARRMPLRLVKRSEQVERAEQSERSAPSSRYGDPIQLPAPKHSRAGDKRRPLQSASTAQGNVAWVVMSSLAIVIGLFFLVVWVARRALPKSTTSLPTDVLEVLGRAPLGNRHNLQLIRLGRRLLLVSVTPDGAQSLTEITDPDEVNHLASLCQQQQPGSITGSFRHVLQQLGTQQAARSRRSSGASTPLDLEVGTTARQPSSLRQVRDLS